MITCESEQVLVDRIIYDTIWIEKPPIRITQTHTDTVWITNTVTDTVTITQQVITTDTVFVERTIQLIDTIYKDVIKTVTVTEIDTVFVDKVEIVESRLTIVHPYYNNYEGIYIFNDATAEWLRRTKAAGIKVKAATVVFLNVRWGNPTFGQRVDIGDDGFYYVTTEGISDVAIWRALSRALLDIPYIELDPEDTEWGVWGGDDHALIDPEKYGHIMFQFFWDNHYYSASPEKQDWYWQDMFNN